jgi:acyl-coenzyme A thioesterase PaaI-like protein
MCHIAPGLALTLELDIDLFAEMRSTGALQDSGYVVKSGRAVIVTSAEITDDDGRLVAVSHATFTASPDA